MARVLQMSQTCDWCKLLGLGVVEAAHEHMLAVDGPVKRFELCSQHDLALKEITVLYQKFGVDPDDKPRRNVSAKKAIAEQAELGEADRGELTALAEEPKAKKKGKPKETVFCPLPHRDANGSGKRIAYADRTSHADLVHKLKIWEIKWEDPDGIMAEICTAHKECSAIGLGFKNSRSVSMHKKACSLELIDA